MISHCIAAGGAVGSLARHCSSAVLARGPASPWGARLVDGAGSPVIGAAAGGTTGDPRLLAAPLVRQFAMVDRCGHAVRAALSLQTGSVPQAGEGGRAALDVVAAVATCLVVTRAGCALAAAGARGASRRSVSWT